MLSGVSTFGTNFSASLTGISPEILIVKTISRRRRKKLIWDEIVAIVVNAADKNGAYAQLREETALFTE